MQKIYFLLIVTMTATLFSCQPNKDKTSDDSKVTGDVDAIDLMTKAGFVSTNPDYNTLYGAQSLNDFLFRFDENVAGGEIDKLILVIRNGEVADTLDFMEHSLSPKEIEEKKYVRHFQLMVNSVANATNVPASIYAYDESDKQLAKISFTLNTKSTKSAGIQTLQFPTSGFYKVNNDFFPYQDNTTPFIGDQDETAAVGDQYFVAARIYAAGADISLSDATIYYVDDNNDEIAIDSEDFFGGNIEIINDNASVLFIDDDGNDNTKDVSFTVSEVHFVDHDDNENTADVATYRIRSSAQQFEPYYEFRLTRK